MPRSPCIELEPAQRQALLQQARRSIEQGIGSGRPLPVALDALEPAMKNPAAVFVTLKKDGALRGCIGSLEARVALVQAVADSAFNAAFRDPRFSPVDDEELQRIEIEISVLSEMQDWRPGSRQSLLQGLRPGTDGLLIQDQGHRATFLPQVWEKMASAEEFLGQLMMKAGLPAGYWSDTIQVQRYEVLSFHEN